MATLAQLAGVTEIPAETSPQTGNDLHAVSHFLHLIVKSFLAAVIAPVLISIALGAFLITLTDFAWFRLRALRNGCPQPKGLWEF